MDRREFLENSMLGTVGAGVAVWDGDRLLEAEKRSLALEWKQKYKVGILGCGNRAKAHISALNGVPEIEVAALCDLVPHKMKRRAQLIEEGPEPEMYSDMEEMVRHDGLDAVAVVLPNYLHKRGAVAALEAGNHVLCEKPMALTVSNCNDMIAAAERNGKALQIGTQLRHRSDFKTLVEAIRKAPVGKILQSDVSTYRGDWRVPAEDEYPPGVEYWRLNQSKCGGAVYEMGAHLIDVNNWVFDSEPVSVTGIQGVNNLSLRSRDSTDHAGVVVRYANDAVMNYGGNLYNYGSGSPGYFFAVDGTVEFSGDQVTIHYRDTEQKDLPETETESLPDGDGTQGQWKYFTRVMGGEAEPYPDGYVGRQTVEICQGAILANREGKTVEVSELERYDAPAG
jgi:predicted dehydrogenase